MRVAITGASGFIGRHVLQRLLEGVGRSTFSDRSDLTVRALASSDEGLARCAAWWPKVEREMLYDAQGGVMPGALEDVDVLVHLGWSSVPALAERDPQKDQQQNVAAGLRLLEALSSAKVRRVVFLSSGGTVYGPVSDGPIVEDTIARPNTAYGISKLLFEQYLRLHAQRNGMESIVLRPGNVYGDPWPRSRPQGVVEHWLACILAGRPIELWSDLGVTRDFIHIDDMVDAVMRSLFIPDLDVLVNVGTGKGTSLGRLLEVMQSVTGKTVATELRGTSPAIIPVNVLDPGRAEGQLGFRARVGLEAGVASLWQMMVSEQALK
ncbi:MAG: NAD-dependent epimerase/dehydratase family protein [Flavobacteriales bacterium]